MGPLGIVTLIVSLMVTLNPLPATPSRFVAPPCLGPRNHVQQKDLSRLLGVCKGGYKGRNKGGIPVTRGIGRVLFRFSLMVEFEGVGFEVWV